MLGDQSQRHAGSAPRCADPGRFDEPHHPGAVTGERCEQLEHAVIVGARLARECPRDRVRKVIVADAHGVRVTKGDATHLGGGPGSDSADRSQSSVELDGSERDGRLETVRDGGAPMDRLGASALDPQPMEHVAGRFEQPDGRGRQQEGSGAGRGLAEARRQTSPRSASLGAGHLLFEDGRHECVEHRLGPWQAQARELMREPSDDRVR